MTSPRIYSYEFTTKDSDRKARVLVDLVGGDVTLETETVYNGTGHVTGDVRASLVITSVVVERGEFFTGWRFVGELVGLGLERHDIGDRAYSYAQGAVSVMSSKRELVGASTEMRLAVEREIATAFYVAFHAGQEKLTRGGRR